MRGTHATESQSMRSERIFRAQDHRPTTLSSNKHAIFKSQSNSCETEINTVTQQSL